ncbi:hypothetical protein ABZ901_18560 [Actinacidiphila alni]|uniref:hypothetical protein n=1 Tax=Actinacidiphila alni TaxID=380248 RepID=UPI0033F3B3D2
MAKNKNQNRQRGNQDQQRGAAPEQQDRAQDTLTEEQPEMAAPQNFSRKNKQKFGHN